MKLSVSKGLRKIGSVILLCILVVLSVTACSLNIPNDDDNTSIRPTVLECYSKRENTFFLKLEISKIYDEVYIKEYHIAIPNTSGVIMLECNVIEDLYGSGTEPNQKIIVPVWLRHPFTENDTPVYKDADINDVKAWLSAMDCIYVYTSMNLNNRTFVVKNNYETELQADLPPCNMRSYELLPSIDGKVCINQVDNFFEERNIEIPPRSEIRGMDWFCPDGISCTEFENNVRALSEYFDSKPSK